MIKKQKLISLRNLFLAIPLGFFFLLMFSVYYQRIGAFGCFDDCFNFMGAYFMLKSKVLYSQIFFNHQMLMPYVSYLVQKFAHPQTIYQLVLYHRLVILFFAFLMDIFLIVRFRLLGIVFVLFYEPTKFYLFGDRFLAESMIIYPLVYMLCLVWYKLKNKSIGNGELLLLGVFTWFIIFAREPYVPIALLLYVFLLWGKKLTRIKYCSLAIFLFLSLVTLFSVPLKDYFFNVVNVNLIGEIKTNEIFGTYILKVFLYPLYIFFAGKWNNFRLILFSLDVLFFFLVGISIFKFKRIKEVLYIFLILGVANLRVVNPGNKFYEAFHMVPWYGLFLMTIFLLLQEFYLRTKYKMKFILLIFLALVFIYLVFSPQSFIWEKIDRRKEFTTGYARYFVNGEVIRLLADTKDTLFIDRSDDLIYWQAKINFAYKYSWYTSIMPHFPRYENAKVEMFFYNPPDFYYGYCGGSLSYSSILPAYRKKDYIQLYFDKKPTCLYVKKIKLVTIPDKKWEMVRQFGYYLPSDIIEK